MQFLLDTSPRLLGENLHSPFVMGQLMTPLGRHKLAQEPYGVDNGAFSRFNEWAFKALLANLKPHQDRCLFVAVPDVVGNARRTLEIWRYRARWIDETWPLAFVAQDGIDNLPIPWDEFDTLFIGGTTQFKESQTVVDLIKTAHILSKQIHIGRVNTPGRFRHFVAQGAHTCDGSGICKSQFRKLRAIEQSVLVHVQTDLFNPAPNVEA